MKPNTFATLIGFRFVIHFVKVNLTASPLFPVRSWNKQILLKDV